MAKKNKSLEAYDRLLHEGAEMDKLFIGSAGSEVFFDTPRGWVETTPKEVTEKIMDNFNKGLPGPDVIVQCQFCDMKSYHEQTERQGVVEMENEYLTFKNVQHFGKKGDDMLVVAENAIAATRDIYPQLHEVDVRHINSPEFMARDTIDQYQTFGGVTDAEYEQFENPHRHTERQTVFDTQQPQPDQVVRTQDPQITEKTLDEMTMDQETMYEANGDRVVERDEDVIELDNIVSDVSTPVDHEHSDDHYVEYEGQDDIGQEIV